MSSIQNKHEQKYFNTARLMNEALLILLDKKEYQYITISELCKKAGVNRSTFYLHYQSMEELLQEVIEESTKTFNEKMGAKNFDNILDGKKEDMIFIKSEYLEPYLSFIKENSKLFKVAKSNPKLFQLNTFHGSVIDDFIFPILKKFNVSDLEKRYLLAFYIGGIQFIVNQWIKTDFKDDVKFISDLIIKYIVGNTK